MGKTIRWGILALSNISRKFTADLALVPDAEVLAATRRRIDLIRIERLGDERTGSTGNDGG